MIRGQIFLKRCDSKLFTLKEVESAVSVGHSITGIDFNICFNTSVKVLNDVSSVMQ